jgi:uncharacterized protein
LIKITSITEAGQIVEREYNNRTAKFTQDGKELVLRCIMPQKQQQPVTPLVPLPEIAGTALNTAPTNNASQTRSPKILSDTEKKYANKLTLDGKTTNQRLLKIQMGLACNYSCTYCKQAIHVNQAEVSKLEDVDYFIQNFDTWCKVPREDKIRVELWGGEPLVYIAKFRKLVAFLKNRFDNVQISTVTNGSLVTLEMAKYLIENDITIAVSHDGEGTKTYRLEDPLAEGTKSREGLRYYAENSRNGLYLNSVMTKANYDPRKTSDYIRSQFTEKATIRVGYEGIFMVEDISQFTEDQFWTPDEFVELRTNLKHALLEGRLSDVPPFNSKLTGMLRDWENPFFSIRDDEMAKCGMDDPYTLAMNLKGTALVCHSSSHETGSVYELDEVKMSNGGVTHWSKRPECSTCPVLNSCRGSCMDIPSDTVEWYHTCNNQFHFHLAIFEAAYEMVFREQILEISGDYVRPTLPKIKKIIPIMSTS